MRVPGSGRAKGTPNHVSKAMRDLVVEALEGVGGVDYLKKRANDPRTMTAFLSLVGKVLPMHVGGVDGSPIVILTGVPRAERNARVLGLMEQAIARRDAEEIEP